MNMACPPVPFEMTADERHKRPISIPNPKTQISAPICLCGVQKICANIFPEKKYDSLSTNEYREIVILL